MSSTPHAGQPRGCGLNTRDGHDTDLHPPNQHGCVQLDSKNHAPLLQATLVGLDSEVGDRDLGKRRCLPQQLWQLYTAQPSSLRPVSQLQLQPGEVKRPGRRVADDGPQLNLRARR